MEKYIGVELFYEIEFKAAIQYVLTTINLLQPNPAFDRKAQTQKPVEKCKPVNIDQ